MKFLFDFFPVLLFFVAYKVADIFVATAVAIAASAAQLSWVWFRQRRFETMHVVTFVLIVVLGGATLYLQDEWFIKLKPTLVNWAFALAFLGSQFFGEKKTIAERLMGKGFELPTEQWRWVNLSWVAFFTLMGAANLIVAHYVDTDTWVNFKLFGMTGLTFAFALLQGFVLMRYAHVATTPADQRPEKEL